MKLTNSIAALALTAVAASTALHAGSDGKDVKNVVATNAPASPTFTFNVSENYDSRYMFRGVDVLAGTGILSTTFAPTWHITANDAITVPLWFATAVKSNAANSAYRELDVPINYTHAIGQWTLGVGYTLYNYFNAPSFCNKPAHQGEQN